MSALESPSSRFSSNTVGKYSAVDGTYQIRRRFNKEKQSVLSANISMNRKEIHLSWLMIKVIRFLKGQKWNRVLLTKMSQTF
jgi:hypothetical protein